jgi:hypothetical protein
MKKMNVDDPELTAFALGELDEPGRSAVARAVADSPELQRVITETRELARALQAQYRLELERGLVASANLAAIRGDDFWSKARPLAIAALVAVLAVIGAVMFSTNHLDTAPPSSSNLPSKFAAEHAQLNQFAAVEAEDAARLGQNEKFKADAGPFAFTGERPFVSVISKRRSSVPLMVNSAPYSDVKRSIDAGLLPTRDSVSIEAMINHFSYEYPQPAGDEPFSLNLDVVTCPWEPAHLLVRIGLKGNQAVAVRTDSNIEVEFNPRCVASYRLIGYDRQGVEAQSSNDDSVASQSIAAGYTLTTFYEVVPAKHSRTVRHAEWPSLAGEGRQTLLTAKLQLNTQRNAVAAEVIQRNLEDAGLDFAAASSDLKFAAAVAEFGMILRDSDYKGNGSLQQVIEWAQQGIGADLNGYRANFIELVRKAQELKKS